jgi:RNA polymerase sigma factor for flagellar operon FliA
VQGGKIRVTPVATGLYHPWSLVFPDARTILVTERNGKLRMIRDGVLLPEPVWTSPTASGATGDALHFIVLHPNFAQNRWVYTQVKYEREERDRLILENLPQVKWLAARLHERVRGRVGLDDLISAGTIGLIAAVDSFDPGRNLQLKTYAEYKIRGAIMDYLRSRDGLSRDGRRRSKETGTARAGLEQRLQRMATHAEVAEEMVLSPREYAETLTASGAQAPFSLDAEIKGTEGRLTFSETMPDSFAFSPEQELAGAELQELVFRGDSRA